MPVVAVVDGVTIQIFLDDHPPRHLHLECGDERAQLAIEAGIVVRGEIPRAELHAVLEWLASNRDASHGREARGRGRAQTGTDRMSELLTITAAEPVVWGVLKIRWSDGQESVADLRPVIADGDAFAFLRCDRARFDRLRLADDGYSLGWVDDDGDDVDFAADSLRRRDEKQAETLRLAG